MKWIIKTCVKSTSGRAASSALSKHRGQWGKDLAVGSVGFPHGSPASAVPHGWQKHGTASQVFWGRSEMLFLLPRFTFSAQLLQWFLSPWGRQVLQRDPTAMATNLPPQLHRLLCLDLTSLFSFFLFFLRLSVNIIILIPTCVFWQDKNYHAMHVVHGNWVLQVPF